MSEAEFRFGKTYNKQWNRKATIKTGDNYNTREDGGSISVTVRYDDESEIPELKKKLEAALDLDTFVLGLIDDIVAKIVIEPVTPPPSTGNASTPTKNASQKQYTKRDDLKSEAKALFDDLKEYITDFLIKVHNFREGKYGPAKNVNDNWWNVYINPDRDNVGVAIGQLRTPEGVKINFKDPDFPPEFKDIVREVDSMMSEFVAERQQQKIG